MDSQNILEKFHAAFGESPAVLVRSPGRINLIGEHTDYNDGFVLPAAIDKAIFLALAPAKSTRFTFLAADLNESVEFDLTATAPAESSWANYFLGVLNELRKRDIQPPPVYCVFGGDLPIGAGLSSSAALECGFVYALNELLELDLSKRQLVEIGHCSENDFIGVQCGIMDQFTNVFGKKDHLLKLDCRTLQYELLPFRYPDVSLLLLDTRISHHLTSSEYNRRRRQCEAGISVIRRSDSGMTSLRDVSPECLNDVKSTLDPVVFKRCHYVVQEIDRVQRACSHLKRDELNDFGSLMFDTHSGLRDDYEVSCSELDFLVEAAKEHPGVLGARLMGAGFGGCTINLVMQDALRDVVQSIQKAYESHFGLTLQPYSVTIESGTSRMM